MAHDILILGCGSIGRCTVQLLLQLHLQSPSQITIIDSLDQSFYIKEAIQSGVKFCQRTITPTNFRELISEYLHEGDVLIDLTTCIDTYELVDFCHKAKILFLNTCIECWDIAMGGVDIPLFARQSNLLALQNSWGEERHCTALVDHGMNPGLISHFLKKALLDFCSEILKVKHSPSFTKQMEDAMREKDFAQMAFLLDVQAIHISEKDSQITSIKKEADVFYGTWSVVGLLDEMNTRSEIGWGSNEKCLPQDAKIYRNKHAQALLSTTGLETKIRSWVPSGEILGMAFRHGEVSTLSRFLSIEEIHYQPSVYYAYQPCADTLFTIESNLGSDSIRRTKILTDEIVSGADEVGCLLMSPRFGSWWTGSVLDIETARVLVAHQNATIIQVAMGVIAGYLWILRNPKEGLCFPENLPHEEILDIATPFLGKIISQKATWDYPSSLADFQFYQFYREHHMSSSGGEQ